MSLVSAAMEKTYIMDKTTARDQYGGVKTVWKPGAEIEAAYSFDSSTESRIAAQQGVSNRFTIMTETAIILRHQDVIKRARDGKTFRITSDGDDNQTPALAGLNLRAVEAEEWEITNSDE